MNRWMSSGTRRRSPSCVLACGGWGCFGEVFWFGTVFLFVHFLFEEFLCLYRFILFFFFEVKFFLVYGLYRFSFGCSFWGKRFGETTQRFSLLLKGFESLLGKCCCSLLVWNRVLVGP